MTRELERDRETAGRAHPDARAGAASAVIVFGILFAVVAVAAGAALLLGAKPVQQPATAPETAAPAASPTDFSLTDEEAIQRFKELEALSFEALEERNAELIASVYLPDSPVRKGALEDVAELKRNNTVVRIDSKSLSISVGRTTPTEIRLRQTAVIRTRFTRIANGESAGGSVERQTIRWSLRRQGDSWLIHDAVVVAAERV